MCHCRQVDVSSRNVSESLKYSDLAYNLRYQNLREMMPYTEHGSYIYACNFFSIALL